MESRIHRDAVWLNRPPERSDRSPTDSYGFLLVGVFIGESYAEIRIPSSVIASETEVGC